ncbi:sensor histidine kinase [Paenibacillus polymyxa]|uniref:sensor histidine kinase n=1 Tax=Paenibacillus polymyxa TaxID=1406 RepID=UPI000F88DA86|nr:sensor histidine kinase [Paenibacillus polymyxa]QDA25775.1 HAMP domain-containing histidine kinase [Paenibacillus polymyxa]RTZ32602.1 HAMP domain-containing histidine kinase [Paenibacillus polymyxa]
MNIENIFEWIVVLIMSVVILWLWRERVAYKRKIKNVRTLLERIVTVNHAEKLLYVTGDVELQRLMTEINRLLDLNLRVSADYNRSQIAMRKMISNISHDLKTPLTVVLGYAEMLDGDPDISPEERIKLLSRIHQKTSEAIELIGSFFSLAKLEANDTDIQLTRLEIGELCRRSILEFYDLLTAQGFTVHIDIPEHPIHALGNEGAIGRVLSNLISNAIRYGAEGRTLGLTLSEQQDTVRIEVWDRGKGIQEPEQDKVFERMYTLEDSRNKAVQGSGLGLTIAKRLVECMNGEMQLTSKPYEQTVFSFTLKKINY